jgi:hypothetical protein
MNERLDTLASHYLYQLPVTNTDKAALVFACGVAATQVYTSQGSGTFGVSQAYEAYQKFNFADAQLIYDTDPDFYDQIIDNIMNALPVHFASVTPAWDAGHNFVVDGYNTDDFYHINFGWGGSYNGWYLLPDEIPYGLTVVEGAVVDIVPDIYTGLISGQIIFYPAADDTSSVTINLQNLFSDHSYEIEMDGNDTVTYLFEVPIGLYSAAASCPGFETITCEGIMIEEEQFTYLDYYLYQLVAPESLTGEHSENTIALNWQHPQTRDFQYFNIYRNISASHFMLLATTTQLNYVDTVEPQGTIIYGYYVTAVYAQENESSASNEIYIEVTGTEVEDNIVSLELFGNYPNPFNPSTTIFFSLTTEITEDLKLCIYNIKGQKLKKYSIFNNQYSITWNGTDENDQPVPSGVYYYALQVNDKVIAASKCLLLK